MADGAPGAAECPTLGRVSRISGQMVELELDGPAPAPRALFVGVTDPGLRVEVVTLLDRGAARGLLLSAGRPLAIGDRLRATGGT
ncbi:MAG TPA: hypothetical protein GXX24_11695, partial [Paracoccus solventivorans]|nr:hypothetical protein [Paracoccus solventivorans]